MAGHFYISTHDLYYSNREHVPIADIIESLQALDRIVKMSPRVLTGLTNVEIDRVEVYIEDLHSGSLTEKIAVKLFFKSEEDLDKFLEKIREQIGKPGMARNLLIGAVLTALVSYGAFLAASSQKSVGATTINANNNVIINIGAGEVDMTAEQFRAIVETAVTDKKALAKSSVSLLKPARADGAASIVLDGNKSLTFSPDVILATPKELDFEKQEEVKHYPDVDLQIRATNLDSYKKGWAAVLPGISNRRLRLELDPSIKPSQVAGKFEVRGDVSVIYKFDKSVNKLVPNYILLRSIIKS